MNLQVCKSNFYKQLTDGKNFRLDTPDVGHFVFRFACSTRLYGIPTQTLTKGQGGGGGVKDIGGDVIARSAAPKQSQTGLLCWLRIAHLHCNERSAVQVSPTKIVGSQ